MFEVFQSIKRKFNMCMFKVYNKIHALPGIVYTMAGANTCKFAGIKSLCTILNIQCPTFQKIKLGI